MAENATLIERTDAFMRPDGRSFGGRRRRSFVATTTNQANTAANTSAPAEEDEDIPVLTEVVSPELPAPEAPKVIDEEALLAIIASDLVRNLEKQLAIELPTLIEAALVNAQIELRSGISATMKMALRDFLDRRQQLSLPFEDLNPDD